MSRPFRACSLLPSALLLLLLPLLATADAPGIAIIRSLSGSAPVKVVDLGQESIATAGMALHDGFSLATGSDTRLTLLFRDGNVRFVGRNASMDFTSSTVATGPTAKNTVAVLNHILSEGAPEVFRNVVTGAAMGSQSGGAPPNTPASEPQEAPCPSSPESIASDDLAGEVAPPSSPPAQESLQRNLEAQRGKIAAGQSEAPIRQIEEERMDSARKVDLKSKKEEDPASAWRAGEGFLPARECALSLGYGMILAPALEGADHYTLTIYRQSSHQPVLVRTAERPAIPAQALKELKPGRVYEFSFTTFLKNGGPVVSDRIPFATFDTTTEANLAECLKVIATLPGSVGQGARRILAAQTFMKYGLFHLARHNAELATKSEDEAIREEAGAILTELTGK